MPKLLKNKWKKIALILTILAILFSPLSYTTASFVSSAEAAAQSQDKWLIYWYICGSDLESEDGSATNDLLELMDVNLPDNVQVFIITGGAKFWQNDLVKSNEIGLYLYDKNGITELDRCQDEDMGSEETLESVLQVGKDVFTEPNLHRAFIFWNHGGGSASGVCMDERTGNTLSLNDIKHAFTNVYGTSETNPPFELVGFDACLMATYDTANSLRGIARYMVASEEVEPGNGWDYTRWVNDLSRNPAMDGAALGTVICNSYMTGCREYGTDDSATMSVIDLSKIPSLGKAYENYGIEALQKSVNNNTVFFSEFGRNAHQAENYGGNNREQGYYDMVDLGDLARKTSRLLPKTSQALINAVNNAVIYRVYGEYRSRGTGISGFYPYDGDQDVLASYIEQEAAPLSQKCLYYYLLYGVLPSEADSLLTTGIAPDITTIPNVYPAQKQKIFHIDQLEDHPVDIDADGNSFVTLTDNQMDLLSAIKCQLIYLNTDQDIILMLGSDSDVVSDWDTGIFKDHFYGTWPMLEGHPVYVEITAMEDDYNLYAVPIILNGVKCNLEVAYNFNDEKYHILGARKELESKGMGSRKLVKLKPGDQITTLHYAMTYSGNDTEPTEIPTDTFTIGNNPKFADEDVGDGTYGYFFEFVTPTGESALSKMVTFTIKNGEITTSID